jgi:uncharacterized protein (TIGR00255 family)
VVRKSIRRGTVQVLLRVDRARSSEDFRVNESLMEHYRNRLEELRQRWGLEQPVSLEALLGLPGVVEEDPFRIHEASEEWPVIRDVLEAAMERLYQMRVDEGRAMAQDLKANCQTIAAGLKEVEQRAPLVAEAYRARLEERLTRALAEYQITLEPADLLKEVGLFAERSDISEETVRLRSHLDQFQATMELPDSSGRKLEFLTQEMFRETNTIGSKANDVEIGRQVIEIKSSIERIREMIQNVE